MKTFGTFYIATVGDTSKVGITKDAKAREKNLTRDCYKKATIIQTWDIGEMAWRVENVFIFHFRSRRVGGLEFFSTPVDELIEFYPAALLRACAGEIHYGATTMLRIRREQKEAENRKRSDELAEAFSKLNLSVLKN
jgi:transcription-repair coupling factor (superfamily II helicase)